jgi:hypothetical protein
MHLRKERTHLGIGGQSAIVGGRDEDWLFNVPSVLTRYWDIFDSINLIKELRSYVWATDRDGKLTGNPIDHSNHLCDSMRYFALNKLNNRPSGKYATISI